MRTRCAFTLIELLVVIAIIALLVSILAPGLTRARETARRAVCSTTISNHGKSVAMYVSLYGSYPHLSPWPWMSPMMMYADGSPFDDGLNGWPKFYGVLEMNNLKGTKKTTWGNWYYGGPVDTVWDGCLCPSMDAPAIWAACDNAATLPDFGTYGSPLWWMSFHKWAVGYQWNPFLRAATPAGRYPDRLQKEYITTMWQWITPYLYLRDGEGYYIQAVSDEELFQPSNIADAWDGWDLDSAPGIPWLTETQRRGPLTPGWHAGVVWFDTRAALNAARHKGSPNILYADGHVAADAHRPIDTDQLSAEYAGLQANTWNNYSMNMFGNADHLIPRCEFVK